MSDKLRPEELWQSLSQSSRDIFSEEEIVSFLEKWSDSEAFVEDLNFVVSEDREPVRPEEVFEHLASSNNCYTVDEMLEMSNKASNREWSQAPDIADTGGPINIELGDVCVVPGEKEFFDLSGDYFGRTELEDGEKDIWLNQHKDYFQFGISPVSVTELEEIFTNFETLAPSRCYHEAEYGENIYNLNSEDLSYFFEFEDDLDDFDKELYRVESSYTDFVVETAKIPDGDSYELSAFCWRKSDTPIEAVEPVLRSEVAAGLKTKLMLQYFNNQQDA